MSRETRQEGHVRVSLDATHRVPWVMVWYGGSCLRCAKWLHDMKGNTRSYLEGWLSRTQDMQLSYVVPCVGLPRHDIVTLQVLF